MPTPTLDTTPDGALVVAADTAEEALSHIGARLGHDAEIVEARKVHRGGWKGFFATEAVELVARARTSAPSTPMMAAVPTPASTPTPVATPASGSTTAVPGALPARGGVAAALAQLTEQADEREQDFRSVLSAQLRAEPTLLGDPAVPAVPTEPALLAVATEPTLLADPPVPADPPVLADPAVHAVPTGPTRPAEPTVPTGSAEAAAHTVPDDVDTPMRRMVAHGPTAWDLDELRRLRLPEAVVAACRDLDPADDAAWVAAIAGAVSTWCRPLPTQDGVMVGPRAHRLGRLLLLPVREVGAQEPRTGSVALRATDTEERRRWVDELAGGRWLHVVAGGRGWHGYLLHDVLAVSWVGDEALPAALSAAARMGLVLGYGLGRATGDVPVRANPLDVALAIRSLLPRTLV